MAAGQLFRICDKFGIVAPSSFWMPDGRAWRSKPNRERRRRSSHDKEHKPMRRKTSFVGLLMLVGWANFGPMTEKLRADPPAPVPTILAAREIGISPESLVVADLQSWVQAILIRVNADSDTRALLALEHLALDTASNAVTA